MPFKFDTDSIIKIFNKIIRAFLKYRYKQLNINILFSTFVQMSNFFTFDGIFDANYLKSIYSVHLFNREISVFCKFVKYP